MANRFDFDLAIVGAGPAGSATALAAQRAGINRIALIDRPPAGGRLGLGESAAPPVGPLLQRLGLEGLLDRPNSPHRHYLGNLSSWGSDALTCEDFLFRLSGHGWHLDRLAFDQSLRQAAIEEGATPYFDHTLQTLSRTAGGWHVSLSSPALPLPQTISARALVDASGRQAVVGRALGMTRKRLDGLVALAVTCPPKDPAGLAGRSFIEAVRWGWWYATLLPNGQAMVTLMSDDDLIRDQGLRTPRAFAQAWAQTRHLKDLVTAPPPGASVVTVSAASQFSPQAIGAGWLAVGDALIGFDPLTSSGIAGALDDALAAADTLACWFTLDPKDAIEAAKRYAHRANQSLVRYMDEHRTHYQAEQRWGDAPFWQRRHQGIGAAA
jgi:flavin-dependent dehydrogenase